MANELSSAGVLVKYALEVTTGVRPTTNYTTLVGIKSIPDLNPEPSSLEVTDLSDTEWKRFIPGLKDPGGSLEFTANNTDAFQTAWETMKSEQVTGAESDLSLWVEIYIPGLTDSFYFSGIPSSLGLSGTDVDAVLEIGAYMTPNQLVGWEAKSTVV
jgi:hypothetical protein